MADMASVLASKDMAGLMRTVGLGDAPSGAPSTALMEVSEEPSGEHPVASGLDATALEATGLEAEAEEGLLA